MHTCFTCTRGCPLQAHKVTSLSLYQWQVIANNSKLGLWVSPVFPFVFPVFTWTREKQSLGYASKKHIQLWPEGEQWKREKIKGTGRVTSSEEQLAVQEQLSSKSDLLRPSSSLLIAQAFDLTIVTGVNTCRLHILSFSLYHLSFPSLALLALPCVAQYFLLWLTHG